MKGIEPSSQPWEGHILPLNHTRLCAARFGVASLLSKADAMPESLKRRLPTVKRKRRTEVPGLAERELSQLAAGPRQQQME